MSGEWTEDVPTLLNHLKLWNTLETQALDTALPINNPLFNLLSKNGSNGGYLDHNYKAIAPFRMVLCYRIHKTICIKILC